MNIINYGYKIKNAGVTNAMDEYINLTPPWFLDNILPTNNGNTRGQRCQLNALSAIMRIPTILCIVGNVVFSCGLFGEQTLKM